MWLNPRNPAASHSRLGLCCVGDRVLVLQDVSSSSTGTTAGAEQGKPTKRLRAISDEEKQKIEAMQLPGDMPQAERKRQYAAFHRDAKNFGNQALLSKLQLCSDAERSLAMDI